MNIKRMSASTVGIAFLFLLLAGCGNLQEIRNFAALSSDSASYATSLGHHLSLKDAIGLT